MSAIVDDMSELRRRVAAMAIMIGGIAGAVPAVSLWLGWRLDDDGWGLLLAFLLGITITIGILYMAILPRARAVENAAERLLGAADGDLKSGVSPLIRRQMPHLAVAMENLFSRASRDIDTVRTMAMVDAVTGLANRTSFCRQVERLLAGRGDEPAALLFIDLDGFKAVNDTLGHAAGDHILARVAGRLREVATRMAPGVDAPEAVIGRFAGDEFILFFPALPSDDAALRLASAVRLALDAPFDIGGHQAEIGASIGVARYPEHGRGLSALLRSADHAMYEAKNSGRDKVRFYSPALERRIAARRALEEDLRHGLEHDEFRLEFQPQVDLASGALIGAEALVRWGRPDGSVALPQSFVPVAEENGLIVELGNRILNRICATAARWAADGRTAPLSLNLSRRELTQPDFFPRFNAAMERHATLPAMLELELAGGVLTRAPPDLLAALGRLRERGVRVAIDDFGVGPVDLSRLRGLPVNRIKIARRLVRDIEASAEARTVCSAVVGLALGLGFDVVAQGIETSGQLELLRVMGCRAGQGYYFARPMSEEAYAARFVRAGATAVAGS